jgi:hypothetical protein
MKVSQFAGVPKSKKNRGACCYRPVLHKAQSGSHRELKQEMKPAQPVERLGRDFIFISASVDSSDGKANFQASVLILKSEHWK